MTRLDLRHALYLCVTATLFAWGAPAGATLKALEDAAEIPLGQAVLPSEAGGTVPVRKCTTCKPFMVTITAATQCFIQPGRKPVPLRELLRAARAVPPSARNYVYVYFNPATRQATRLVLDSIRR